MQFEYLIEPMLTITCNLLSNEETSLIVNFIFFVHNNIKGVKCI